MYGLERPCAATGLKIKINYRRVWSPLTTMVCVVTSGSATTPIDLTAWSPMERAMASPICVMAASSHTLELRPGSGGGLTNPPAASIRAY